VPAVGETIAKTTSKIKKIIVACDSGMGSSAMVLVLKNILKKSGYADISVEHSSANQIAPDADLVITLDSLIERAKLAGGSDSISYLPVNIF
jgi:mannitol PTS system EIICBA or EIICB component